MMIKYFGLSIMLITFLACGNDAPNQNSMQGEMEGPISGQMPYGASSETEVSDEELNEFIDALGQAQEVQAEAQMEMLTIVQNEELEVDTYNQIAQAIYMGEDAGELEIDPADMTKYERASAKISEVEQSMEEKLVHAIESEGMSFTRFEEINIAIQQDAGLQQRIQQMIQAQMPEAPFDEQELD